MSRGPGSPTLETLAAFAVVFLAQSLLGFVGAGLAPFALAAPVAARPWTLATSVYAHADLGHLLTNGVAVLALGLAVERATTRVRFHAFFLATGALAGLSQVAFGGLLDRPTAVLGASGAVMALLGYLVTGNRLSAGLFARFDPDPGVVWAVYAVLAVGAVVATAGPGVALVAHGTGFVLGLAGGRLRLLRVEDAGQ